MSYTKELQETLYFMCIVLEPIIELNNVSLVMFPSFSQENYRSYFYMTIPPIQGSAWGFIKDPQKYSVFKRFECLYIVILILSTNNKTEMKLHTDAHVSASDSDDTAETTIYIIIIYRDMNKEKW